MFSKGKTVVAHIDHNRVLHQSIVFQIFQHILNALIHAKQRLTILLIKCFKRNCPVIHIINPVPAIPLVFHPLRDLIVVVGCRVVIPSLVAWWEHRRRISNFYVLVDSVVTLRRLEFRVNTFVRQVKKKWFVLFSVLNKLKRVVRQKIWDVSWIGKLLLFTVDIQRRIVIYPLPLETHPVIKSFPWFVVFVAHMPFAHEGSLISGQLQIFRKESYRIRYGRLIVDNLVMMGVLTGQNTGPARRTQCRWNKSILQMSTLWSQTVHAWSF